MCVCVWRMSIPNGVPLFGLTFVGKSFFISSQQLQQVGECRWVLDVRNNVCADESVLKEVCLMLLTRGALADGFGLAVYVSAYGSEFEYRGCVSNAAPSATVALQWPQRADNGMAAGPVQLGLCIEEMATLAEKESIHVGEKTEFARRVGMDLFRFMQSFPSHIHNNREYMLVPHDIITTWFNRFKTKFEKDQSFLTRPADTM